MTGIRRRTWCWPTRWWTASRASCLLHADRNGVFYVLDRTNGKFLWAKPFVNATWAKGFDKNGRPIVDPRHRCHAGRQGGVAGGRRHQLPGAVL